MKSETAPAIGPVTSPCKRPSHPSCNALSKHFLPASATDD